MPDVKTLYQNLRIKYKLLALITAVMATVGVLIVAVQQYAFQVYDREIYEQSSIALNQTSVNIENELRKVQQQSYRMATDEVIQKRLTAIKRGGSNYDRFVAAADIRERFVVLGGLDKYVRSVQMIDYYGVEYFVGRAAVAYSDRQIAVLSEQTAAMQGGNTWILPNEEDGTLSAARQIRAYDRLSLEKLGVVSVRIDMDRLMADLAGSTVDGSGDFLIVQGRRVVYPADPAAPADPAVSGQKLYPYMTDAKGYKVIEMDGRRFFITYLPSAYTGWTYVTLIPYDDIFNRIAGVRTLTLLLFSALFLLALLFAFRFAKGITNPIERLNAKMKRVQLGNFTYEEDSDDRSMPMDEAGQLHRNFRIMLQRIDELIREDYVKQLAMRESEFKALQAQINPHFLYNTLETINWSSKIAGQHHISSMVESLGFLLRSSINLKEPLLPLKQELDIVLHYINIQKIRFEERLDFRLEVPDGLQPITIPKLSIQPLVENAVNYAMERMTETCMIRVEARDAGELIELTVTDNGPGMDEAILERLRSGDVKPKGSGVGLRNIDERIKLLFGEPYGLDIESRRWEGTVVRLRLPKETGEQGHV